MKVPSRATEVITPNVDKDAALFNENLFRRKIGIAFGSQRLPGSLQVLLQIFLRLNIRFVHPPVALGHDTCRHGRTQAPQ